MKKKDLEYLRTHAATGEVFNQQLISTQVETIYSLTKLNLTIERANKKNGELERSNHRLQGAMFILTLVTVATAIFGMSEEVYKTIGLTGSNLLIWASITTTTLTVIIMLVISIEIEKW